jgi:hypothetical protein
MQKHGLGMLPYLPLAAGLLTGKYKLNVPFPADARLVHSKRWSAKFVTEQNCSSKMGEPFMLVEPPPEMLRARNHTTDTADAFGRRSRSATTTTVSRSATSSYSTSTCSNGSCSLTTSALLLSKDAFLAGSSRHAPPTLFARGPLSNCFGML